MQPYALKRRSAELNVETPILFSGFMNGPLIYIGMRV
jgi:hypothetical protein